MHQIYFQLGFCPGPYWRSFQVTMLPRPTNRLRREVLTASTLLTPFDACGASTFSSWGMQLMAKFGVRGIQR